jgi:molybdenum cofactor cytidylyltransferase
VTPRRLPPRWPWSFRRTNPAEDFRRTNPAEGKGLWCVVLAAGASRRLGRPKQLVRYRSRALMLHAVDACAVAAPGRVIVVLGARSARLQKALERRRPGIPSVRNPRWRTGLASSLRAGLVALPARAKAALFLLADQPAVDASALERLISAWRRAPLRPAAARYDGRLGVPAILPRRHWPELRRMHGDVGARVLLRRLGDDIAAVDLPEAAVDIDTEHDLTRLLRSGPSRA